MDDRADRQLVRFLGWYADNVARDAGTDEAMVRRVVTRHGRDVTTLRAARLRLLGIAAILAAILTAMLMGGLIVGGWRPEPIDVVPALPAVDLLTGENRRELAPATYAVHGFRPPFAFTLPRTTDGHRWITCCSGPDRSFVGLIEQPSGSAVYIWHHVGESPAGARYCEPGFDGCPETFARDDGSQLPMPAAYWMTTLDRPAVDIVATAGAATRAQLDEFLPRARSVIESIDFESDAVTSSPPPGTEPMPPPETDAFMLIGAVGFGRELRYVPADHAPPVVTAQTAIDTAAGQFRKGLALNSRPLESSQPVAVVRRIVVEAAGDKTPRSIWIVAFETSDRRLFDAWFIDDQTGQLRGSSAMSR